LIADRRLLVAGLIVLGLLLAACSQRPTPEPLVKIVTVVVTTTPASTPTPIIITEIQTVVVTATAQQEETSTPEPAPTNRVTTTPTPTTRPAVGTATVPPTETPVVTGHKYSAPVLIAPVDSEFFTTDGIPVLRWAPVGELAPDEYYEVTIERTWQSKPYYAGSDWTKDSEYIVPKTIVLNTSDTDQYTWWVTVKRLTGTNSSGGKIGEALSPPSETRTFTWK
jgi:hypothetical protein